MKNALEKTLQITREVTKNLDIKKACEVFINLVVLETMPEGSGSILIVDPKGEFARIYASYGLNDDLTNEFHLPVTPSSLYTYPVLAEQRPVFFNQKELEPYYQDEFSRQVHKNRVPSYQYSVPLIWRGESIGVVSLNSYDKHSPITEEQSQFIGSLSLTLSYHFSNAREFQRTEETGQSVERQKRELEMRVAERTWELEISKSRLLTQQEIIKNVIEQKDLKTASEVFLEGTLAVVRPSGSGSVFIYDPKAKNLRLYAHRGLSKNPDMGFVLYPDPEKMYNYEVITKKKPLNFSKKELEKHYTEEVKSYHYGRVDSEQYSVPMVVGEEVIGMMVISHYDDERPFHEDDFQFLINLNVGLSHHFAIVRLLEETQEKERIIQEQNINLERKVDERTSELKKALHQLELQHQQLVQAQKQLVESEKLAALGQLTAGVAHEINTPVGVSVSAASHLEKETKVFQQEVTNNTLTKARLNNYMDTAVESSEIILRNLERAALLVQSFKKIAVDQTGEDKREFELSEYIREVLTSLAGETRMKNVKVNFETERKYEIESYAGAFAQIITNFMTNALRHGFDKLNSGVVEIRLFDDKKKLNLVFSDNGRGIAEEHLDKVFEPFFTTKRSEGGSGLGLYIVYNLVHQKLKGEVKVRSKVNEGASFHVLFPM